MHGGQASLLGMPLLPQPMPVPGASLPRKGQEIRDPLLPLQHSQTATCRRAVSLAKKKKKEILTGNLLRQQQRPQPDMNGKTSERKQLKRQKRVGLERMTSNGQKCRLAGLSSLVNAPRMACRPNKLSANSRWLLRPDRAGHKQVKILLVPLPTDLPRRLHNIGQCRPATSVECSRPCVKGEG